MQKEANQNFNFDNANLADQITAIGRLKLIPSETPQQSYATSFYVRQLKSIPG